MREPLPEELARAIDAARSRLGDFANLRYLADVDSTNDVVLALAQEGAPHGVSVLADSQRAGRGRRGRSWFSPPGAGVYLSMLVRPPGPGAPLSLITLAAGVAATRAIAAATGLPAELKWPNDVVVGRPWRKLGGILCEGVGAGPEVTAIVIGVGLNLQHTAYPPEVAGRATSIEGELGRPADRAAIVVELLAAMGAVIDRLWTGGAAEIRDEWRRAGRAGLGGAPVRWQEAQSDRRGLARDIDEDGALLVDVGGASVRLVAGEVIWERLA